MLINYTNTGAPTSSSAPVGSNIDNVFWSNPSNIEDNDGSSATVGYASGGDFGAVIAGTGFGFDLPPFAVVDGVKVTIDGANTGMYGDVRISASGSDGKSIGTLNKDYGGETDLWGLTAISIDDINSLTVSVEVGDVSGGDGFASIDYLFVTVYWHLDIDATESDVPTRVDYKVYDRSGAYLGLLPNVISELKFSQDINSAGSTMSVTSQQDLRPVTITDTLLTEGDEIILTESGLPILTETTELFLATGDNSDEAMFKNSNRIEVWLFNRYYPNGKRMFKGQVNKVSYSYGGNGDSVTLLVYSDGFDLSNYITRTLTGYSTDQNHLGFPTAGYYTVNQVGGTFNQYGQTFKVGAGITNISGVSTALYTVGSAEITCSLYDAPNGNFITSVTKTINSASITYPIFLFPNPVDATPGETYFYAFSVADGDTAKFAYTTGDQYADGSAYENSYAGGGGGSWSILSGQDFLAVITHYGFYSTNVAFTSDDPVTDMASNVLSDYNDRGGYIVENDFEATGLSLSYTWQVSSVFDTLTKILELCPSGYYMYIDLGNATMDLKALSGSADYTVVNEKDIHQLDVSLSIETLKNSLLFTGGDTGGGSNLYQAYNDITSQNLYGLRTVARTDNRVTLTATADAIGETFIAENSSEIQETRITILNKTIDITLLTPGKTIGFRNFGSLIDDFVLQIVRREYTPDAVTLTLGKLPPNLSAQVQAINRGLLNEQTLDNPSSPS